MTSFFYLTACLFHAELMDDFSGTIELPRRASGMMPPSCITVEPLGTLPQALPSQLCGGAVFAFEYDSGNSKP